MRTLDGKIAFITGGASGIGLGMARAFLGHGMRVMVADLRQDYLHEASELLRDAEDRVAFMQLDVSDRAAMLEAAKQTVERFGAVHVLCNNAGVGTPATAESMTYEDWDWVLDINLGGTINGIMSFLPILLSQGQGGHIVSTASMAGLLPTVNGFIYAASKYAIRGLSDSLRLSLAPRRIGVSVLYPGLTRSRMVRAEENRQARYGAKKSLSLIPGPTAPPDDAGMDPLELGECVVDGIRGNAGYIIGHFEHKEELAEHFHEVLAAFPEPGQAHPARLVFEEARRLQTAEAQRQLLMTDEP
jgi:NAD(P)-dependent dehydrogenase (short-subunit alcohol dehydrogenase family)